MDQPQRHRQSICNSGSSLGSTGIRADNNSLLIMWYGCFNIPLQDGPSVKIIHGDVQKPLILGVMQVHRDDMVCSCACDQVCNKSPRLRNPLLVSRPRLKQGIFRSARGSMSFVLVGRPVGHRGHRYIALTCRNVGAGRIHGITTFWRLSICCEASILRTVRVGTGVIDLCSRKTSIDTIDTIRQSSCRRMVWVRGM